MVSLVIQAGGESRRMGRDKGLIPFLGRPLIIRVIERVLPLAEEVIITTNQPDNYRFTGYPLFSDLIPGRGALGGVYTALARAKYPFVAIVACDMPFANLNLLTTERDLLVNTDDDLAIAHSSESLEPFHAVYRRDTCLPAVEAALQADKWRVDAWFSQVKMRMLREAEIRAIDPDMLCFRNINTPEELAEAEALASRLDP